MSSRSGRRRYWPIYEAAEEVGLPIGVHAFGFGRQSDHGRRAGRAITSRRWSAHSQCQQTAALRASCWKACSRAIRS